MKKQFVRHFRELEVYRNAMELSMRIFGITKRFLAEESRTALDFACSDAHTR